MKIRILLAFALMFFAASCFRHTAKTPARVPAKLDQIESHLFNGLLLEKNDGSFIFANLAQRMKDAKVPGVSYAVIQENQIYGARTHGLAHTKPPQSLKEDTLLNAGSISKTATGLLCARLHELGKIDLDKSINDYLKEYKIDFRLRAGIKITENDLISAKYYTSKKKATELLKILKQQGIITEDNYLSVGHTPKEQVSSELLPYYDFIISKNNEIRKKNNPVEVHRSLRQILSHSAGISVSGLPGYFVNEAPTKLELLTGSEKSLLPAIEVVYEPYEDKLASISAKTKYHYAGGGYIIIEVLLEKMFGQTFEEIADKYLFRELGMTKSTFEQTGTNYVAINGIKYTKAEGYNEKGQPTNYGTKVFPAKSMAGLWSTPSDIAKMAIALNNSLHSVAGAYLSQKMAEQVLIGVGQKTGGGKDQAGLGVFSNNLEFGHSGSNPGFGSNYVINRDGSGFVWMLNGNNLGRELLNAANFLLGQTKDLTKYRIDESPQDLEKLTGHFQGREFKLTIELKDNQLLATLFQKGQSEPFQGSSFPIYPIVGGKFAANSVLPFPIYFKFSPGAVAVEHKEWPDMEGVYKKS